MTYERFSQLMQEIFDENLPEDEKWLAENKTADHASAVRIYNGFIRAFRAGRKPA